MNYITKEGHEDLASGFNDFYKQAIESIKIFEGIFEDNQWNKEIRDNTREILTILYKERNLYGRKSEQYRTLYNTPEGNKRIITWR